MNFFTEDHRLFRSSLRAFLDREVVPHIDEWERQGCVPKDIWLKMGEMGYLGLSCPEEYGGSQVDFFHTVAFWEEISRCRSGGFAGVLVATTALSMPYILHFGSDDLRRRYLPGSCRGELRGCLAITEPEAGSNVAGIQMNARRQGDVYLLNGSKTFITGGVFSEYLVVAAKTQAQAGAGGISLFVVDRDAPGLSAKALDKLGFHASDTGELHFQDVPVPASNLLGEENMGFYYIMQNFALERISLAVCWLASCEQALQLTLEYMSQRQAFGKTLNRFQTLRHRMAQLAAEVECCRIYNYHTALHYARGENAVKECAIAKLRSTELADRLMYQCLQCFGGYGYMESFPLARMFRDSRVGTIAGGTSEIMCDLIARFVIDQN